MTLRRRHFLQLAAGALATPAVSRLGLAQGYPSKPIRMLVGFPPGNAPDIMARLFAQSMSERLGQQVVVENRPGAASNIAVEATVQAPPDGYTILMTILTNVFNMTLYPNLRFNFIEDVAAVAGIADAPYLLLVNPKVPAKSVTELIAYAKANPGKINFASGGNGSSNHIFTEWFKALAGIDIVHVPYRGPYIPDVLTNQVQMVISPIPQAIQYHRNGELRTLGVSTAKPLAGLPGVPTIDASLPGYVALGWYGLGAPKNTPPEIVSTLNKVVNESLADPKIKEKLAGMSVQPMPMTPAESAKFVSDEHKKWSKVIKDAGVKLS